MKSRRGPSLTVLGMHCFIMTSLWIHLRAPTRLTRRSKKKLNQLADSWQEPFEAIVDKGRNHSKRRRKEVEYLIMSCFYERMSYETVSCNDEQMRTL